jgi:hypothetical protein
MIADSTFLWLDATAWTALATIVAAALGLYGAFWSNFWPWLRKPVLELGFDRFSEYSELIGNVWWLRLPVSNRASRRSAQNVEVFLESIREEYVQHPLQIPKFLPIRLIWAHGGGPVCDRIAGGAYRLLDLGQLTFTIKSGTGFVEAVMARLSEANPMVLGFTTEIIPIAQKLGLPVGSYTLDFLIASDSTVDRRSITITIRNQLLEQGAGLQQYLHVQTA